MKSDSNVCLFLEMVLLSSIIQQLLQIDLSFVVLWSIFVKSSASSGDLTEKNQYWLCK